MYGTTSQPRVETELKRKQAMHLRTLGYSYERIGYAMGVSATYATHLVKEGMQRIAREESAQLVDIEARRLDKIQEVVSKSLDRLLRRFKQLEDEDDYINLPASAKEIQQVVGANLAVMERRSKMFGLDAPKRTEITGANGGAIETKWTVEVKDQNGQQLMEFSPGQLKMDQIVRDAEIVEEEEKEPAYSRPWE